MTVVGDEGRISPATVDRRLEDQLLALEHTTEAAIKRNKDLQLTIKNLQRENEVSAILFVVHHNSCTCASVCCCSL